MEKGGRGRLIGRTKGGMNTKLHAVTDARGRPIQFFVTAGQVSDYTGLRRAMLTQLLVNSALRYAEGLPHMVDALPAAGRA